VHQGGSIRTRHLRVSGKATPLKFTGLSGEPPEQRLQRNGRLQRKPEKRYSAQTVRVESEQALEGAPDSEQNLSGAAPDCLVAQAVRALTVEP
jgi:hypothetical protein